MKQKIRFRLKAYDHKLLDMTAKQIVEAAERTGALVAGPVPLPTRVKRYSVIRSGFIDKDSQEQFEIRIHKRLIDVINPNQHTINVLEKLHIAAGVDIEITPSPPTPSPSLPSPPLPSPPLPSPSPPPPSPSPPPPSPSPPPPSPPPPPPRSNPFEQTDDTPLPNSNDDLLLRSRSYDRLLLWLSAVGHGSWRIFQNTCQELGLVRERNTPATILRRLRLSGHIETSSNRNHWSVAPSVLVKRECTDNGNEYFLCGARDAHLVQQLWEIAEVSEELQVYGHAPARIFLQVDDIERVQEHCSGSVNGLHIGGNVAYRLAQRLPPLADWMDTLEPLSGISPYQFITRMLTGTGFEEKPFDDSESGMYELWSDEPPAPSSQSSLVRPDYTLFYDAEKQRWLRGDWYGLRFLALQLSQMSQSPCSVRYEPSSGQLAIYQDERWPELYERVLVLASGKLPRYQEQWLIYESISQRILDALIPKLNLKMIGENHYA